MKTTYTTNLMTTHQKLLNKWTSCEFGVKTRVFSEVSQQQIDYILKHPNYSDEKKMNNIINIIKAKTNEFYKEATEMYKIINKK